MTSLFIEALVLVFCVGGILGAVVAMHLQHYRQEKDHIGGQALQKAVVRVDRRSQK